MAPMSHGSRHSDVVRFRVVPAEQGMLLTHVLARRMPNTSVQTAQELVRAGGVYIGRTRIRVPTVRVAAGERLTVHCSALAVSPLSIEQVKLLHRDPYLVIVDKPPGVPVTATRESARGSLAEALVGVLEAQGVIRPYVGVVHRLDRGASGLVLFTVRSSANRSLHRLFMEHAIERTYLAELVGIVPDQCECDASVIVIEGHDVRIARSGEHNALAAHTSFRRLAAFEGRSLVEVVLATGRTHQIRVHAAHLGHPIVGDARYGNSGVAGLHLHAFRLAFEHPVTHESVRVEAPWPDWATQSVSDQRQP